MPKPHKITFDLNNPTQAEETRQQINRRYPLPLPIQGQSALDIPIHLHHLHTLADAHHIHHKIVYFVSTHMRPLFKMGNAHTLFVGHYLHPDTAKGLLAYKTWTSRAYGETEKQEVLQLLAALRAYYNAPGLDEALTSWIPPFTYRNSKRPT